MAEAIPLLPLDPDSKSIFCIYEDPEQAYRLSEMPFRANPAESLEENVRHICQDLQIPPLSSYLMGASCYPNLAGDVRRWLTLGERPFHFSELRLCCRHFTPQQLAFLSENLLYYHFLTVKYDLLHKSCRLQEMSDKDFQSFVSLLLTLDICRLLAKARDENQLTKLTSNPDLITSLVRKYEEFCFQTSTGANPIKKIPQTFLWKKTPNLLQQKQLPDLVKKIQGKHWTDFIITYLENVEKYCPTARSNRYRLYGHRREIEIGPDGLSILSQDTHRLCDVTSAVSASFRTHQVIELVIADRENSLALEFETEADARSFAVELTCYFRILSRFGRPLFDGNHTDLPSQNFQATHNCWGPLSIHDDHQSLYQASALLGPATQFNAIAFESAAHYDVIGVLVMHRGSRRETVRWYRKCRSGDRNELGFLDIAAMKTYPTIENAVSAQMMGLVSAFSRCDGLVLYWLIYFQLHLHAEADQSVQPRLYFDAASQLPALKLFCNNRQ